MQLVYNLENNHFLIEKVYINVRFFLYCVCVNIYYLTLTATIYGIVIYLKKIPLKNNLIIKINYTLFLLFLSNCQGIGIN